ncbi:unnamed protein product [Laminaria digitata]
MVHGGSRRSTITPVVLLYRAVSYIEVFTLHGNLSRRSCRTQRDGASRPHPNSACATRPPGTPRLWADPAALPVYTYVVVCALDFSYSGDRFGTARVDLPALAQSL